MKITHDLRKTLSKDLDDNDIRNRTPALFLLSKRGHYFATAAMPNLHVSNFFGWLNMIGSGNDYTLYKSIESIYLTDDASSILKPAEIINRFSSIERRYVDGGPAQKNSRETFTLLKNGLVADVSASHSYINIDLDFREIFDFDDKGRIYRIYHEKLPDYHKYETRMEKDAVHEAALNGNVGADYGGSSGTDDVLVVEYTKYSDNDLKDVKKKYYLAIYGIGRDYETIDKWEKRYYDYDASRNSRSDFYIYRALRILCSKDMRLVFGFSEKKEHAIGKVIDILFNMDTIKSAHEAYSGKFLDGKLAISELCDDTKAFAYVSCLHALDCLNMHLTVNNRRLTGIWAGLPWFFQFWSRDEIISSKALIQESRYEDAKDIYFKYLNEIKSDGRLPNIYPPRELGSADSIGWLFLRLGELIKYLQENNMLSDYFSLYDLKYVHDRLRFSLKQLSSNYMKDGLIFNHNLETWMDTSYIETGYEADFREGFRIEIQVQYLSMLRFMSFLDDLLANRLVKKSDRLVKVESTGIDYRKEEKSMRNLVRKKFLSRSNIDGVEMSILNDAVDSSYSDVARPNVFIAYYFYPELLTEKEWNDVFDYSLERLWCEWRMGTSLAGGLSTIDKKHSFYQPYNTGQNNKSYHRGDSWFYVNNMAAICMNRLDRDKYSGYIDMIHKASADDILFSGFIGCASEITSSAYYRPCGCFCQAWSIATYIELMHEVYM